MAVIVLTPQEVAEIAHNAAVKGACLAIENLSKTDIVPNKWYSSTQTAKFLGISVHDLHKIPKYVLNWDKQTERAHYRYKGIEILKHLSTHAVQTQKE